MQYVNLTELSRILDISNFSLYPNMKRSINHKSKNYNINIEKFLIEHKINNFMFSFEYNKKSFSDRLIIIKTLENITENEFITAKQAKNILKINDYNLSLLKNTDKIEATKFRKTRYNYKLKSILNYLNDNNRSAEFKEYKFSKQFYTPQEVVCLLQKNSISISLKSVYRYIYNYNLIPCIKVCGSLRIPILEFNEYVLKNIDTIFLSKK